MSLNKLFLVMAVLLPQSLFASEFSCPGELKINESITEPVMPWHLSMDDGAGYYLEDMMVFYGPPENLGTVQPQPSKTSGAIRTTTWLLAPAKESYWVACSYQKSRSLLSQPIPRDAKRCTLTERIDYGTPRIEGFACR